MKKDIFESIIDVGSGFILDHTNTIINFSICLGYTLLY